MSLQIPPVTSSDGPRPVTLIQRIEYCANTAMCQYPDDKIKRTETFIAALSGVLQREDLPLANQIFALLNEAKRP